MIQPQPYKVICKSCSWNKIFAPKSDVLMPQDIPPDICPSCKSNNLEKQKLSLLDEIISAFKSM